MPDAIDKILIELGYDTKALDAGAKEALNKTSNLAQQLNEQGQKGGHSMGEGIVHGLRHNLKHLKKEAGLIAAYVGAFMGSETANGFKGTFKEGIAGAIGGLFFGGQLGGAWGAGIGAVVGGAAGIVGGALKETVELRKAVKELGTEFNLTADSAQAFHELSKGEQGDALKKTLKEYIDLLEEFRKGTDKAREALGGLLGKANPNNLNEEELARLVKTIEHMPEGVAKYKAIMGLPGGEEGFNKTKEFVEKSQEQKHQAVLKATGYSGFSGQVTYTESEELKAQQETDRLQKMLQEHQKRRAGNEREDTAKAIEASNKAMEEYSEGLEKAQKAYNEELEKSKLHNGTLVDQLSVLMEKRNQLQEDAMWVTDNEKLTLETKKEQLEVDTAIADKKKEIKSVTDQIAKIQSDISDNDKQQALVRNQMADKGKFGINDLVDDKGNWKFRPATRQGEWNLRAGWEVKNAEGWARMLRLNGLDSRADQLDKYAKDLRSKMGVLSDNERFPNKALDEKLGELNKKNAELLKMLEEGRAKVRVGNGQ